MSKIYTKALAAAVALGLSSGALAADVTKNSGTPEAYVHAWEVTGAATATRTATVAGVVTYDIKNGDNVVLRAQPVKVVVKANGALIDTLAVLPNQTGAAGAISYAADSKSASFTYTPAASTVIGTGPLFNFPAGAGISLKGLSSAQNSTVSLTIELRDPTTDALIDSASSSVLSVKQATDTYAVSRNIGVNVASAAGGVAARSRFVTGTFVTDYTANLGRVFVDAVDFSANESGIPASILGSGNLANDNGFARFAVAAGDTLDLSVTTVNGAAFAPATGGLGTTGLYAYPADNNVCAAAAAGGIKLDQSETNPNLFEGTVTLTAGMVAAGGVKICGYVNGVSQLSEETISVTAQYGLADATGRDPDAVTNPLAKLAYNGAVVDVWHVNPAANAAQESYLRITNMGATSNVVITGRDDAGVAGAAAATLNLAAGKSVIVTSSDLENGNAAKGITGGFGAGTGKWRVTVTAPQVVAGNLRVQNFLRNSTSAGIINTNVNNNN